MIDPGTQGYPTFVTCKRSKAPRFERFYNFLNILLSVYHSVQVNDKQTYASDFWNLKVDCCYVNGAFVTVGINELLDKEGFINLYEFFRDNKYFAFEFHPINDTGFMQSDTRKGIFQALFDNVVYKKYDYLLLFPSTNTSTDHPYKECKDLNVEIQRLKVRNNRHRGFLFKNQEDINFCLLTVNIGIVKRIVYLPDYAPIVNAALIRDKNYNEKISSTV